MQEFKYAKVINFLNIFFKNVIKLVIHVLVNRLFVYLVYTDLIEYTINLIILVIVYMNTMMEEMELVAFVILVAFNAKDH